jgi:hypothetical protein
MKRLAVFALLCIVAGCSSAPPTPTGSGAREVVTDFYESLARRDGAAAYARLHPDSQKQLDRESFLRRVDVFRSKLGFELGKIHVRSCDEQGDKAVAQLVLSDSADSTKHRYREGAILRTTATGWGVVLPKNFGQR